jgi:hypothetical protein
VPQNNPAALVERRMPWSTPAAFHFSTLTAGGALMADQLTLFTEATPRARQTLATLERLRKGPADKRELTAAGAGEQPYARIYDLRQAGFEIDTINRRPALALFRLVHEPTHS